MKYIRIGVTGGRNYSDTMVVDTVLSLHKNAIEELGCRMFLVVGDATGADRIAREWAIENLLSGDWQIFEADWNRFGKAAGPIRNQTMLNSGIDKLCAFPGGTGTANMTFICREAGVYITEYK